jgi:hypothetical protein
VEGFAPGSGFLVPYRVDTRERNGPRVGVTAIAPVVPRPGAEVVGTPAMGGGIEVVEDDDVDPSGDELVDDV